VKDLTRRELNRQGAKDKQKPNHRGICKRIKIAPQSPPVSCEIIEAIVKAQEEDVLPRKVSDEWSDGLMVIAQLKVIIAITSTTVNTGYMESERFAIPSDNEECLSRGEFFFLEEWLHWNEAGEIHSHDPLLEIAG
jgi:hypothetical protein